MEITNIIRNFTFTNVTTINFPIMNTVKDDPQESI